jgi:hypothetical protein
MTSIEGWLSTRTADMILSRFAKSRNIPTHDKSILIKSYLTHTLISDARIIRVQDLNDPDNIMVQLLAEYTQILEFFGDNSWHVPEAAQI